MNDPAPSRPWIVIPAHNRRELTLACLRHLADLGELDRHTVLVVDDGSTDGTGQSVALDFPGVAVWRGDGNLWWTGAVALGMNHAFTHGASAVCWLNDDCHPEPGTLAALAGHSGKPATAITAPVCVADDTGAPVATAFIGRRNLATGDSAVERVDGVSGFCVWIPREVWRRTGVPDRRRFPHYYGDTAYLLMAGRQGYPALLLNTHRARLVHYRERASSVREFSCRPAGSRARWREVFVSFRSPFRLATQFHHLVLRYGRAAGSGLFLLRCLSWHWQWLTASLSPVRRPQS